MERFEDIEAQLLSRKLTRKVKEEEVTLNGELRTCERLQKEILGSKAIGCEVIGGNGSFELRESPVFYNGILRHENDALRAENAHFRDRNLGISID